MNVNGNGGFDSFTFSTRPDAAPTTYSLSYSTLARQINGQAALAQVGYTSVEE